METNEVTLRVKGQKGQQKLSPANFDIRQISLLFDVVEPLLYPSRKGRSERPIIAYEMRKGSVLNVFRTSPQAVIAFSAVLTTIEMQGGTIDALESESAKAIEDIQDFSIRSGYTIEITTSDRPNRVLSITPTTHYSRRESIMVDTEAYYYGKIVDAGGKGNANIHLATKDYGTLTIRTEKDYLAAFDRNPLYHEFAARVSAKQNIVTGDIDLSTLTLIELIDYRPRFDEGYIRELVERATPKWAGVDADEWLAEIRGRQ